MGRFVTRAFPLLTLLSAQNGLCFLPNFSGESISHSNITKMAALRITLKLFQEIPNPVGHVIPSNAFQPEGQGLTAEKLFETYYGPGVSVSYFKQALKMMTLSNTKVDLLYVFEERRHFDSETLREGKAVLLRVKASVIQNIRQRRFQAAQGAMGTMLHTLQDFYSHSNWIELGFKIPNSNLIKPGVPIGKIADKTERTCTNCASADSCKDNILESILKQKTITTGYFGTNPLSKPKGKCSHGGKADLTRFVPAFGGINKDTVTSPHSEYHKEAARVATEASLEAFHDIREAVGDEFFLKFLNIASPSGLSFVIDTTGSMKDDIEAAKQRTINIVKGKQRTKDAPSFYLLVPFNDPDFGPVYKTSDPEQFIERLRLLTAEGGGDIPEMCLSALQLALINTPPLSYIYVFTDAPARDPELETTIVALIEQTKSKVSFLLTNALSRRRRSSKQRFADQLYKHLAQVSGGLAVVIRRELISQLTSIIEESATAALVIVLQRENNPDYPANTFTFHVDSALQNVTVYISGKPANFEISSPKGVQQTSRIHSGDLGTVEHLGDLFIIRLHSPTDIGEWDLTVISGTPYSVKVTGQSVVDFTYDFIELFSGPHPGFVQLPGRPLAGEAGVMAITVTGLPIYPSFSLRNVTLLSPQGEALRWGFPNETASPDTFLVTFRSLPANAFYVRLMGEQQEEKFTFHRQSPTLNSVTNTAVRVTADPTVKPGTNHNVSFTVTNNGKASLYLMRLTNDQQFSQSQPYSIYVGNNQSIEGTGVISVPEGTEPGTMVTVTVEAQSQATVDFSYSILQLTVTSEAEDITPPACSITATSKECRKEGQAACGLKHWTVSAMFTESGTGMEAIYTDQGNRTMVQMETQDGGRHTTVVHYSASCCFPDVEFVGIDKAGNVGLCSASANNRGQSSADHNMAVLLAACLMSCVSL
ncbi:von Willebrand factor A domain-containing protein 7-like [Heptranchias perlo]|uniref:von Willebrand factor A domain-containing protein 7-like n=1 Tax=Heptranchias perlo TaxID=212740 RepID=UPI003559CEB8